MGRQTLVCNPVVTELGQVHMCALSLEQDIVAGFTVQVVVVSPSHQDVVTDHTGAAEVVVVVADEDVEAVSTFDPVVAFAAIDDIRT